MPDTTSVTSWVCSSPRARLSLRTPWPDERFTYGLRRTSVLAALARMRFFASRQCRGNRPGKRFAVCASRPPVAGLTMIWVAALGVCDQRYHRLDVHRRPQTRSQRPRRFHSHGGGCGVSAGVVDGGLHHPSARVGRCSIRSSSLVIVVIILIGTWGLSARFH